MDRPLIKDMTSADLYALDFAKMEPAERAAFRDELHEKPGHGPLASPREHRIYAEAHARWSDWIKDHPEDDDRADGVLEPRGETKPLTGRPSPSGQSTSPASSQPRPDGTSPRRPTGQGTGL